MANDQTTGWGSGLRVGTVQGAPVLLMPSWFLVVALVTYFYAPVIRAQAPGLGAGVYLGAFAAALLLLGSVFLHELAHAIAARSVGSPPSRIVLDLWGGHTAFEEEMTTPGRSALVSLVGPATNAALAVMGWLIRPVTADGSITQVLLDGAVLANAFVAVFNALPGLPLDGGRALEALVWRVTGRREAGTRAAGWGGRAVVLLLVVWTIVLPLMRGQSLDIVSLVWVGLIALMLWQGAGQALALATWRSRSRDISAVSLMRPAIAVPSHSSITEALQAADMAAADDVVLLDEAHRPVAILDPAAIDLVPSERLSSTPAPAVARAIPALAVIPDSLTADHLLRRLQANPHSEYVVVDAESTVRGVLRWDDVADRVGSS